MSQGALQRKNIKKGENSNNEQLNDGANDQQHYDHEEDNQEHDDDNGDASPGDDATKRSKSRKVCVFYRRNNCKFGDNCKYSHPNVGGNKTSSFTTTIKPPVESEGDDDNDAENAADEPLDGAVAHDPAKFRTKPCRFYRRGHCNSGDECPFLHTRHSSSHRIGGNNSHRKVHHDPSTTHSHSHSEKNNHKVDEAHENQGGGGVEGEGEDQHEKNDVNENDAVDPDAHKYKTKPCRYFRRGKCDSGDACKFLHAERGNKHHHSNQPHLSSNHHSQHHHSFPEVKRLPKDFNVVSASSTAATSSTTAVVTSSSSSHDAGNVTASADVAATTEVIDSRIRTKPCTYFRRGHCRTGDACLFLHVTEAEVRAMKTTKKQPHQKHDGKEKIAHTTTSSTSSTNAVASSSAHLHTPTTKITTTGNGSTFTIYSTSSDKKRSKEIQYPLEDRHVNSDHFEDLDPFVILVSWEVRPADYPNHATIKRGLHDIFVENLGFYETNSPNVLEADVASLCNLLEMKNSEDIHKVIPVVRARLNTLIDAGLKSNNGLYGDYNAAAVWLNTIYNNECDSMPTSPKEEAAPLVMYFARRPAIFAL